MADGIDDVLHASLLRAEALFKQAQNPKGLNELLASAQARLKARLEATKGATGNVRFTEAHMVVYSKQIELVTEYVTRRLGGMTAKESWNACQSSVKTTAADIATLDKLFTGIATPLKLYDAGVMAGIAKNTQNSLLVQHQTSVARYGQAMIGEFRSIMRDGLLTGTFTHKMVDDLVAHGGPGGLFQAKRYWAARIVRTEVAHAANASRLATIIEAQKDFPDMGKKILATFDTRTAQDSMWVHGQVRAPQDLFQDGAGRQYLRPPGRPNDRETIVPWRLSWPETEYARPVPPNELAQLAASKAPPGPARRLAITNAMGKAKGEQAKNAFPAAALVTKAVKGKVAKFQAAKAAEIQSTVVQMEADKLKAEANAKAAAEAAAEKLAKEKAAAEAQRQAVAAAYAKGYEARIQAEADAKARAEAATAEAQARVAKARKAALAKAASDMEAQILEMSFKDQHTEGWAALKAWAKSNPATFAHSYREYVKKGEPLSPKFFHTLAKSPSQAVASMGKFFGLKQPVKPPKPPKTPAVPAVPPAPPKPYVQPSVTYDLSQVTHTMTGDKWNDIFSATTNQKLGYILKVGDEWQVDPPQWLKDKGWDKLSWPAKQGPDLAQATHYALQVSYQIKNAAPAPAAVPKAAPSKPKVAAPALAPSLAAPPTERYAPPRKPKTVGTKAQEAYEALQTVQLPGWSAQWRMPERPVVSTAAPAKEIAARLKTSGAPGVAIDLDGGAVENHRVQAREYVREGQKYLELLFKTRGDDLASSMVAAGASSRGSWEFLSQRGSATVKTKTFRLESGGVRVELGREKGSGADELSALHNQVRVRVPVGNGGAEAAFGAATAELKRLGLDIENRPDEADRVTAARAKIMASLAPQDIANKVRAGMTNEQIGQVWKEAVKARPFLQEVEDTVEWREVAPGHLAPYSAALAKAAVEHGYTYLSHRVYDDDVMPKMFENGAGLLASNERHARGIFTTGMSTERDFETGGADGVFLRLRTVNPGTHSDENSGTFIEIDPSELGRLDAIFYNRDRYGNTGRDVRKTQHSVLDQGLSNLSDSNEWVPQTAVPVSAWRRIHSTYGRDKIIQQLRSAGLDEVNGVPLEKFVVK